MTTRDGRCQMADVEAPSRMVPPRAVRAAMMRVQQVGEFVVAEGAVVGLEDGAEERA